LFYSFLYTNVKTSIYPYSCHKYQNRSRRPVSKIQRKIIKLLARGIWDESELASALNGLGETALMERAQAGSGLLVDPGIGIQKLLQGFRILVINFA